MEKCIPVEEIEDGMILTRPVENENGMVLCGAGTKLTLKHISRFHSRGVLSVFIKAEIEISPLELDEKIKEATSRFSAISDSDTFDGRLKKVVLTYLQAKKDELINGE